MSISTVVSEVVAATPDVTWSIAVTGRAEAAHDPGRRLSTASIGKILLLAETARQIAEESLDPGEVLRRDPAIAVADSGLWQHLAVDALPLADVAVLIAGVSDNYATNVLLQRIGVDAVRTLAASLGLRQTALNRMVRNVRVPGDGTKLSTGSARELAALMHRVARGKLISAAVSERLDAWLAVNTDLSMVAAGLHLDPLAHVGDRLRNKTGTDDGIRADVGYLRGERPLAYAVLANWDPEAGDATEDVMAGMRRIGTEISGTQ
ncbi:serine hydrolase [Actinoplanes sp. NBRC 103695]|uniref:serine hydrolase n=1 Tax=Actinoplanes sp. NBRC 103695 TaxID=3032202 RepID=UPI0024A4F56A|nr:serine hydrolase [Actinoplanes sp. NBRC 103695]GLY93270.1 serine hydrolase [Actinoplanes sp. NBRC 103695]